MDLTPDELAVAFEKIEAMRSRLHVINPTLSLVEMQRLARGEEQHYECLAGWNSFFMDWDLQVWRCLDWHEPMCSVYDFDETMRVRDGCTRCMSCHRDASMLYGVPMSVHDSWQALKRGRALEAGRVLGGRYARASWRTIAAHRRMISNAL